ncbi:unnamed protein product [Effrenium voratum]|nr:unnamed protein product [Effrenium voratum]
MLASESTQSRQDAWLPPPAVKHGEGMMEWAEKQGLKASSKVDFFSPAKAPSQGFCARALEHIDEGELLLNLPLGSCLRPLPKDALVSAEDTFVMDEQQKLMLQLLHEVLVSGANSSWFPYIRTLPRAFPTLPLWYSEEERRFLKGTSVDALLEGGHIASDKDLHAMQQCRVFSCPPSLEQLRWAASVVASRAFDSSGAGVVLAPFADALNHSGAAPHTRMRDCGEHLVFHAEREINPGEEIMNCYGLQGNTQWLLNGGFLDRSRPCDDLLVTPPDVVNAALTYLQRMDQDDEPEEDSADDDGPTPAQGREASLCSRLFLLQDLGIGENPFCLSPADLLPDDLATMLLAICMTDSEFGSYQEERAAGRKASIDLGGEEGEALSEQRLADLYGCLLCLVELLQRRYETSLEEDLALLQSLDLEMEVLQLEPPVKRPRALPPGVRPENARNILLLRVGQKRVLAALAEQAADCFAD